MGLFWIVVVLFVMVALLRINNQIEDKSSGQKKSARPHDDSGWWFGSAEHLTSDGGSDFDGGGFDGGTSDAGGDSSSSF